MPVQIILATNKEVCVSEKTLDAHRGVVSTVQYSKVFFPNEFASGNVFVQKIQSTWDRMWVDLYGPDSLPPKPALKEHEKEMSNSGEEATDGAAGAEEDKEIHEGDDVKQEDDDEEEEEGNDVITENWCPPYIHKPGMRTGWVQVRFTAIMMAFYSAIAALIWYLCCSQA